MSVCVGGGVLHSLHYWMSRSGDILGHSITFTFISKTVSSWQCVWGGYVGKLGVFCHSITFTFISKAVSSWQCFWGGYVGKLGVFCHSITFTFISKAVSSWQCFWGGYVGKLPFSTVSKGRASSSASECHSICWNPCFPQWTAAPQHQQHSYSPRPWCYPHHAWL